MALVLAVAGVALVAGVGQTPLPTYARLLAGAGCLVAAGVLVYVSLLGGGALARISARVASSRSMERSPSPTGR